MCSNPVLNSHFPSFRSLPIQYTRQPKVFSKWGHHQPSFQSSELNQTQISMSASPVFLQPELMHKGFRTTRRLDVFSNACPAKDSDAHLGSRFHSCKLTDEKYQYADIMNCDPDSIGECFIIAYAFPSFISVPVTFLLSSTSPFFLLSCTPSCCLSLPSNFCSSHALKLELWREVLRQESNDTSQVQRMQAIVMRSMTTQICHVWCYILGLTSRSGELCFSNYLQYKTKINEQLCSGEGKWVRSSQICEFPSLWQQNEKE